MQTISNTHFKLNMSKYIPPNFKKLKPQKSDKTAQNVDKNLTYAFKLTNCFVCRDFNKKSFNEKPTKKGLFIKGSKFQNKAEIESTKKYLKCYGFFVVA